MTPSVTRTRLLVSVTDAAEAIIARENGADLIDVKDPSQGSLGAQSPIVWREVLTAVGPHTPVSAALGELGNFNVNDLARQTAGLAFAKVGLAGVGHAWCDCWIEWRSCLANGVQPVMVMYADWHLCGAPPPHVVRDFAAAENVPIVLIDTFHKQRGSLRDHFNAAELLQNLLLFRQYNRGIVLAGSLQLDDLPHLLPLAPDYVAVRGAVCRESRDGPIDGKLVRDWSRALSAGKCRE